MISMQQIHKKFLSHLSELLNVTNSEIARLESSNLAYPLILDSYSNHLKSLFHLTVSDIKEPNLKLNTINAIDHKINVIRLNYDIAKKHVISLSEYIQFLNTLKVYVSNAKKHILNKQKIKLLKLKAKKYRKLSYISEVEFKYALDKINIGYSDLLLKGKIIQIGGSVGKLQVVNKYITFDKPKIDWGKSLKFKQEIIEQGKTPYNKKEEEYAVLNNIPYNGVYWFIYKEGGLIPYIIWHSPSHTIPRIKFTPNTANNTSHTSDYIAENYTIHDIIHSTKLGTGKKLRLLTQADENYTNNFDNYDL